MFKRVLLFLILPNVYAGQIQQILQTWQEDKDLKNAGIGFCAMDAKTSTIITQYNQQLALIPASTLKVVTTSAALGLLGADFRYETKIFYTGEFDKTTGVLNGDLIILGSGDPTLQSDYFTTDSSQITDKWALRLKDKGLKKINGNIVGDASCFERLIPNDWIWADIGNYFGAVPCGLSYADNKFKIIYETKQSGTTASLVAILPQYIQHPLIVDSDVSAKGSKDEAIVYGDPFSFSRTVKGTIPPEKKYYEIEAALPDPALLCAEMLKTSLIKKGITCENVITGSNYKKNDSPQNKQLLFTHYSPTLGQIVQRTNLHSNNQYCEALLKTLGKGSSAAGIEIVKNYWQQRGLNCTELFMTDASGLSRSNTITAHFQAQLLCKIYNDSLLYKTFNKSLPIAGKSGSMSQIGKKTFIENNMRAKTGYIGRVRAYCGFVTNKSGKDVVFSLLLNNYNCNASEARLKLEKFLIALGEL